MIYESTKNKNHKEKGRLRGLEIVKLGSIAKTKQGDYFFEVIKINPIDTGVEVFVKAWTGSSPKVIYKDIGDEIGRFVRKDIVRTIPANTKIGFGDGTIEIERFKFHNPPITIQDPEGDIVLDYITTQGEAKQYRQREDPRASLLYHIERATNCSSLQMFDNSKIVLGKEGHTVSTFNSVAGANSPVDAQLTKSGADWNAVHDATDSDSVNVSGADIAMCTARPTMIQRSIFLFDTSSIGSDDISIVTWQAKEGGGSIKYNDNDGEAYVNIYISAPANNDNVVVGDYDSFGTTGQAVAKRLENLDAGIFNVWTFTQTGRDNIVTDGITKLGGREGHDAEDIPATGENAFTMFTADSSDDPILTVTHEAAAVAGGGGHQLLTLGVG
jgi:hypothetical protein|tara:strand:+ start:58 stop:1212 length:1155 start_codon:yes stop_codon:yes gene_type:complete